MIMVKSILTAGCLVFLFAGCKDDYSQGGERDATSDLYEILSQRGLDGDPSNQNQITPQPDISDPKAQLGMKLFYSTDLSGEGDTACVSCHHPILGGGDDLSLPIGVHAKEPSVLGLNREHSSESSTAAGMLYDGGPTVPRNSPTTFNFSLYQLSIFHDGRIEKDEELNIITPDSNRDTDLNQVDLVSAQAHFPITSHEEMASTVFAGYTNSEIRQEIAEKLSANSAWINEFEKVYGSNTQITYALVAEAIAHFEASQVFTETPWKSFVSGNPLAISQDAAQGALLFYTTVEQGGAGCSGCHSGDFFTDEDFHNLALPQIGRGKGDGADNTDDFGRFRVTNNPNDLYKFRTPTLLNVEVTAPYGHTGSYQTLKEIIEHHINPQSAINQFDFTLGHLQQSNIQTQGAYVNTVNAFGAMKSVGAVELNEVEVNSLVEFLKTLTDPCVKLEECLTPWVASDNTDLNILVAEF